MLRVESISITFDPAGNDGFEVNAYGLDSDGGTYFEGVWYLIESDAKHVAEVALNYLIEKMQRRGVSFTPARESDANRR